MLKRKMNIQRIWGPLSAVLAMGTILLGISFVTVSIAPANSHGDDANTDFDSRKAARISEIGQEAFIHSRFVEWLEKYRLASDAEKRKLEAEGARLAAERRRVMAKMIADNPSRALDLAVMPFERQGLPQKVLTQLEDFVEGEADYAIRVTGRIKKIPDPIKEGAFREEVWEETTVLFEVDGKSYSPYFYGKRANVITTSGMPFYGVSLDGKLAVHESPLRILRSDEDVSVYTQHRQKKHLCPICNKESSDKVVGVAGRTIHYFDQPSHANQFREELWKKDNRLIVP